MGKGSQNKISSNRDWYDQLDRRLHPFSRFVVWTILFQVVFLVYWPSLKAPFVYDDIPCIAANPDLRFPFELGRFFSNHESSMQFDHRPLVGILTMINFQVAGLDVVAYRILNLLIHWSVAVVLGEFIIRLAMHFKVSGGRLMGMVTSVTWALHPLNTVTVIFISQRMESLMVLFYLLSLWSLFKAGKSGKIRYLIGSLVAAVACLAGKEVGVSLLASLLMLDRVCHFGSWKELAAIRWEFYLVSIIVWGAFVSWWMSGERIAELQGMVLSDPWLYFKTECRVLVDYVRKVFWPSPLVFVASPKVPVKWMEWGPFAVMLTLGFLVCARIAWKGQKWVWVPAFLFFLVLGPTSSFLPIPQEPEAEWRMYLPSACILVLFLAGCRFLVRKLEINPRILGIVLMGSILALAVGSWQRATTYRTAVSLWTDNVNKDPLSSKAWVNLGVSHYQQNNFEGVANVSKVLWNLGVSFDDPFTRANSLHMAAWVEMDREDFSKAETLLRQALSEESLGRYRPDFAYTLIRQGKIDEALEQLEICLKRNPEEVYALALYGEALIKSGKVEEGEIAHALCAKIAKNSAPLIEAKKRVEEHRLKIREE